MKLPWSEKSKKEPDQKSKILNSQEFAEIDKKDKKKALANSIINCDGKKYTYNSLPGDLKKLVDDLNLINKNIQIEKDYLKSIAIGRNEYCRQLKNKLKSIKPLNIN